MKIKEKIITELYALLLKYDLEICVETERIDGGPESISLEYNDNGKRGFIFLDTTINVNNFIERVYGQKYKWEPEK